VNQFFPERSFHSVLKVHIAEEPVQILDHPTALVLDLPQTQLSLRLSSEMCAS
jgi:hypothetical protein